jgi:cytochrome P450
MALPLYPPGPKGKLTWLHALAFYRSPLDLLMRLAREYGDLVHLQIGPTHIWLLNHPDYIKDVLVTRHRNFVKSLGLLRSPSQKKVVPEATWLRLLLGEGLLTSEGDVHQRQRRVLQPAFHAHNLARCGAVMTQCAARTRERWRDRAALDIAQEMRRLTLTVIGKALFGADVESEAEEISQAFATIIDLNGRLTMPLAVWLQKFSLPTARRFRKALGRLHVTLARLVAERRASGADRDDLLSLLLYAQNTGGDEGGMTEAQVWDHMRTFFLTGYFTTANALTWTWYLLSQHPDVEAKLHAELDSVLMGRLPAADDLEHLQYTRMVFAEALRLYPPIWAMPRWALNDYEAGGCVVPARSLVVISQYVTHHDPRYFPDPFRFDPQRYTPEAKTERPAFAYFRFGGGPRQCIGEGFAWMEGVLLLATLAQQWQMRLVPGYPVKPQPQLSTTLRPRYGVRMTLERRKSLPAS